MKAKRSVSIAAMIVLPLAISGCKELRTLEEDIEGPQSVTIATGPKSSLTNEIGNALAKSFGSKGSLKISVTPETTSNQDQPAVIGAQQQFGIYNTQEMDAAVKGVDQFKGHAQPQLRIAARLLPVTVAMLVRKDSKIQKVADLKGKRFPTGYTAQQPLSLIVAALLANGNLAVSDIKAVAVQNLKTGDNSFLQKKADVALWSLGGESLKTLNTKSGGIRILPMTNTPEALARIEDFFPNAYLFQLQPSQNSIGITDPTWVMAYDLTLVTSEKVSASVVYRVVKDLHAAQAELAKSSPLLKGFNPAKMGQQYPGQLYHPGAIKFYKEAGIWVGN